MIAVYPDHDSLSLAAAEVFARYAQSSIEERDRFTVSLSGGSAPLRTYELLAGPPFRDGIDWKRVHVFWGDERCVPLTDPRSNAGAACRTLLDRVPVPRSQIHPISCTESSRKAAREYEALLRSFFPLDSDGFDLAFLGLGTNGHTASLFPESDALGEREKWAAGTCPAGGDLCRVTLTASFFNRSAVAAFIVSGEAKADVLREVLEGPRDPRKLPAQLIAPRRPGSRLLWLLDQKAASRLRDCEPPV